MMAMWRSLGMAACVATIALAPLAGCSAKQRSADRARPPTPLRVGVTANYPPLCFEEDGEIKGVEPDLARLVGRELGRPVEFQVFKLEDLIPALNTERIDVIMAGMSVTPERERQVQFTKPYAQVGQMALIRRSDQSRATDYAQMNLPTSRVGVKRATTGEAYARESLPRAKIVPFETVGQGKAALRKGEVDYFIHDAPTVWRTTGRFDDDPDLIGMYRPLTAEYLAWAVRPADAKKLGAEIDRVLDQITRSGELETVLDRWLPVRRVTVG
jgi:polar amino acid transport system substrate-binding protein